MVQVSKTRVYAFILYSWRDPRKTAADGAEFVAVDKDGNIVFDHEGRVRDSHDAHED